MGAQRRPRQGYYYSNGMIQLLMFNSNKQKSLTLLDLVVVAIIQHKL